MTASALTDRDSDATWTNASILVGALMFGFALAVSAFFDPQWRVLHVLQALPYVAIIVLTRRRTAWGFGAGTLTALFWNILVLFRSPVGSEGLQVIGSLMRTGHVERPDILMQLFAACGHVLIIGACLVGFSRMRPVTRDWARFVAGGALAIGYLVAMAFTAGPPEAAQHLRDAFGL